MSVHSTGLSREERSGTGVARIGGVGELPAHLDCVRTIKETAAILGVGEMSLRAMIYRGEGPQVTRLSARRIGIRDSHREAWLTARAQPQPA